jgi:hypothetical protein
MQNPTLNTTLKSLSYPDPMYQLLRDGDIAEFRNFSNCELFCLLSGR